MPDKTILIAGTYDTKDAELAYLADVIRGQGGGVLTMDVSVLGDPSQPTDVSKHEVAEAGGSSIQAAIDSGDENTAMQIMARGAATKALELYRAGTIDGVIVLGGTMGTDLALDLCAALPVGVPKYIVSTVSFSPLMPPERIAADVQMILWAGGLYGLNSVCKAALSQAAGAVLGAARAVEPPKRDRPLIGMTSFGKTVLRYMVSLKPALEARGYEVAVFHATGMGGRAFESLASEGAFAAVLDFAPQEVSNHLFGGLSAGADRMTNAGAAGTPQLVAPGCYDLVDFIGWQETPPQLQGRPTHAHNRLLTSAVLDAEERRLVARTICDKLGQAKGPVAVLLPKGGCNEWDRPGADLHDGEGLAAFCDEMQAAYPKNAALHALDCHINDAEFADKVLEIFDAWVAEGVIPGGSA
ncbi:Tm-1-like ATP-binding domain-containing protein [Phaeobacter sp. QD34_3]|uniref:Tm-1-like ATP-binding domain-containing protein n=1 Tax=unclassified Phaeobacter TaxID=2621772 RepID=UPI00237FA799|nr:MULTISPECIES: Tm-1-like ATP-binding domain-containing protein [unclassified Phaeobacter]MDE4132829.1 Tm-1-like ATP-binding domain-containing protein [Phaeobacter sp. QD34_3]MDE4136378.1 Tm-1-like ATP-binding domain-containing protein [Phaeobacter sp. QD34_24]MDE4174697.1 Tm-1-like ATP-binding domain-containing protein [Phaeobacter sp. PT47_59]